MASDKAQQGAKQASDKAQVTAISNACLIRHRPYVANCRSPVRAATSARRWLWLCICEKDA